MCSSIRIRTSAFEPLGRPALHATHWRRRFTEITKNAVGPHDGVESGSVQVPAAQTQKVTADVIKTAALFGNSMP